MYNEYHLNFSYRNVLYHVSQYKNKSCIKIHFRNIIHTHIVENILILYNVHFSYLFVYCGTLTFKKQWLNNPSEWHISVQHVHILFFKVVWFIWGIAYMSHSQKEVNSVLKKPLPSSLHHLLWLWLLPALLILSPPPPPPLFLIITVLPVRSLTSS